MNSVLLALLLAMNSSLAIGADAITYETETTFSNSVMGIPTPPVTTDTVYEVVNGVRGRQVATRVTGPSSVSYYLSEQAGLSDAEVSSAVTGFIQKSVLATRVIATPAPMGGRGGGVFGFDGCSFSDDLQTISCPHGVYTKSGSVIDLSREINPKQNATSPRSQRGSSGVNPE